MEVGNLVAENLMDVALAWRFLDVVVVVGVVRGSVIVIVVDWMVLLPVVVDVFLLVLFLLPQ